MRREVFTALAFVVAVSAFADAVDKDYAHALTFGADAALNVFVHDENGQPVEGAKIDYAFWLMNLKQTVSKTGVTDKTGHYLAKGKCSMDVHLGVSCEGYYSSRIKRNMSSFCANPRVSNGKWQPFGAELPILLRKKKNPVALDRCDVSLLKVPVLNEWIRNVLFGSLFYMAPELILQGVQPSLQSDLFSLAKSLPEICGTTFPAFESFYHVATDSDPERRPHDILTWLAALDKHLDDYARRHAVLSPKEKFLAVTRKSSRVAMIGLVAVVVMWAVFAGARWMCSYYSASRDKRIPELNIPELISWGQKAYDRGDYSNAVKCFMPGYFLHDRESERMLWKIRRKGGPSALNFR